MRKKTQKIINGTRYVLEAWLASPGDVYKFGIQALPRKGQRNSFSVRLSEEFIEDEIDNKKRPDYLEQIALRVAENHIQDMFTLSRYAVIGNIRSWFKEAKRQLQEEKENCIIRLNYFVYGEIMGHPGAFALLIVTIISLVILILTLVEKIMFL